jgi:hypothetical protein
MKKILGLGGVTTDQIGVVDHIPSSDEVIRLQEYRLHQGGMVATALVAALKCTHLGGQAGLPSYPQVQRFLSDRGIRLQ